MNHPQPGAPASMLEAPLAAAVAAAGVGLWELDLPSGREWWSDTTLVMYGLPPGSTAPTRSQWHEHFLHPDDEARWSARAAEFLATREPYVLAYRIRRAGDGAVRWLHSRAAFAAGSTERVFGVTFDITEQRQAEEQAQEALLLLNHAAEQVGFGFGYRDASGQGVWSPQLKRLFGLAPDAPTPGREQLRALIAPHDLERALRTLATPVPAGGPAEFSFDVLAGPGGGLRTLSTRAVTRYDAMGVPQRTHFAVMDTTERLREQRRSEELLLRLQMTTEATGIGTWERDAATGAAVWDATMNRLWGLPPGAPPPDREQYLAMLHPEDRALMERSWQRVDDDRSPLELEFRVLLPGGGMRWLRTRGRVLRDEQGRPVRRIGVCFDTTDRREAEAALHARALAEQANAAKTEFLSRMSHELRTPLNAVLGFAQLMALDSADPLSATQRERIGHVQAAGWHLLSLVNDVLDLARIEAREAPMSLGEVAIEPLVRQCLDMTTPLAERQGVTLRWLATPGAPAQVWADPTRLLQLLLNLVSNGVKYNRRGGFVEVTARMHDTQVLIAVRDDGLGLSAQQQAQLFQPFNRLGREHTGVEGSGLGLALCKLLAEQMGGAIEVHSAEGQGSEFRLRLPRSAPPLG